MSHDLYRDIYLAIRTRTCATVAEAKDATEAVIAGLVVENQQLRDENKRLRAETGQHRIDLEEYRRDVESLTAERDHLKAALEAMGQDPGAPFVALYTPRCDADYLCKVPDSAICRRCGKPIKFTEAAHDKANGVPDEIY